MLRALRLWAMLMPALGVAAQVSLPPAIQSTFRILGQGFGVGCIGVDGAGNMYVAGSVSGGVSPPNTNTLGPAGTKPGLFVAKISASGKQLVYLTEILDSLSQDDRVGGMAVQSDGSVILDGGTGASDFPTTAGSFQPEAIHGGAFLLKLDPTGQKLVFSTYLDDSAQTRALALASDGQGNFYLGGVTDGVTFPTTPGAYQGRAPANANVVGFVSEISADGKQLLLSTLFAYSRVTGIAVDATGAIHIAGYSGLALLNASASQLIYYRSVSSDYFNGTLGIDGQGNSYITPGDYFNSEIVKFDSNGAVVYDKQIQGAAFETILVQDDGTVFTAGFATGPYFMTRDSLQPCDLNLPHDSVPVQWYVGDAAFMVLDPSGNIVNASFLGGGAPPSDGGDGTLVNLIAQDPNGSVFLFGLTNSFEFPDGPILLSGPGVPTFEFGMKMDLGAVNKGQPTPACLTLPNAVAAPVMPATLMTIFGSGLGPVDGVFSQVGVNNRVPVELAGTKVTVGGFPAPILYAQDQQINFVVPQEITGTTTNICVAVKETQSCLFSYVGDTTPGIFRIGDGYAVVNQDGTLNTPDNPAAIGSVISLFGTGFGPFEGLPPDGTLSTPPYARLQYPVTATFDGLEETFEDGDVLYAGAAPLQVVGVVQINVRVPFGAISRVSFEVQGGTVPKYVQAAFALVYLKSAQ